MCSTLNHCLTLFTQQEELRKLQLQQEMEKSRVLQEALHVLATEHHDLEESVSRHTSPTPRYYDTDDDEFYDCDEGELSFVNVGSYTNGEHEKYGSAEEDSFLRTTENGAISKRKTSVTTPTHCVKWGTRASLPVPMFSRSDFSVWSILKQCIGKELSKVTMPVVFNEPLSFLQRLTEYLEYAQILNRACECDDPIDRLQYVTAFAVSASASNWDRLGKPFNPLLGETYELEREDLGFKIACEQVSHHPPISAFHVESQNYEFHGSIQPKLKFWGKSVDIQPKGLVTVKLKKHGETYTWHNVGCSVHNIIVGKLWVEHHGTVEVINHNTNHKVVLNYKPAGWFHKDLHKLEGVVYNENKQQVKSLYGSWTDALFSLDPESQTNGSMPPAETEEQGGDAPKKSSTIDLKLPGQKCLWQAEPRPENSNKYFSFTSFAMTLNEAHEDLKPVLPPTDCRLRPDVRKLEMGDIDAAAEEKVRLEEKQRGARKQRKKDNEDWRPRWFYMSMNPYTGKEDWEFNGEYYKRDWTNCPDIF